MTIALKFDRRRKDTPILEKLWHAINLSRVSGSPSCAFQMSTKFFLGSLTFICSTLKDLEELAIDKGVGIGDDLALEVETEERDASLLWKVGEVFGRVVELIAGERGEDADRAVVDSAPVLKLDNGRRGKGWRAHDVFWCE